MSAQRAMQCFNDIVDAVEARCLAGDGPVTPTLQEMREDELAELWRCVQKIRACLPTRSGTPPLPAEITQRSVSPELARSVRQSAEALAKRPDGLRGPFAIDPAILAAHAQFGGDLEDMQRRFEEGQK